SNTQTLAMSCCPASSHWQVAQRTCSMILMLPACFSAVEIFQNKNCAWDDFQNITLGRAPSTLPNHVQPTAARVRNKPKLKWLEARNRPEMLKPSGDGYSRARVQSAVQSM